MSAPCRNALDCPCLHIQHCPPHHSRMVILASSWVEGGWARALDLGLQEAPEAEVQGGEVGGARRPLSALQTPPADDSVPKLVVQIPHIGIGAMDWGTNRGILILINNIIWYWAWCHVIQKSWNQWTILNHMGPEIVNATFLNKNPLRPSCCQKSPSRLPPFQARNWGRAWNWSSQW